MNSRTLRRKPYFAGPARRLVRTSRSLPGFGAEGCVLVAMLSGIRPGARIFYLDTDLLFPETYALRDRLEARYGLRFERRTTRISLGDQAVEYGERLWERQPDLCCRVRKVEPLKEMLTGLRAWVTAIRREQAIARANIGLIERREIWFDQNQPAGYVVSAGRPGLPLSGTMCPTTRFTTAAIRLLAASPAPRRCKSARTRARA